MKFSAPFELLEKAIAMVNSNSIPDLLNDICPFVLIETNADNTAIVLSKSDLDVHITSTIKAQIQEPGRTLIHGENFEKIIKTYAKLKSGDDCSAIVSTSEGKFSLAFSDNKKYKPAVLASRDPDHFTPSDPFKDEIASCEITASQLRDFFVKNLVAMNKTGPGETSGVYFKFSDNNIELTSSNKQEAAIIKHAPLSTKYASQSKVFSLIPRKTLETVNKIIKGGDAITVAVSVDMVRISGTVENVEFSVLNETYHAKYPLDGDAMIPQNTKHVVSIPTVALKNALAHMEAIMVRSEANRITIRSDPNNPGSVTLSCRTALGEIPGLPIPAKLEKMEEPSDITLNDQRLSSLLKAMRSQNITLSYNEVGSACSFKGEDEPYFTLVANSLEPSKEVIIPSEVIDTADFQDLSTTDLANDIEDIESLEL